MIKTFKHKALKKYWEDDDRAGLRPDLVSAIRIRLNLLNSAYSLDDIKAHKYLKLHPLKGGRKGEYAISVNKNWRLVFEFKDGNVYVLNLEDYH